MFGNVNISNGCVLAFEMVKTIVGYKKNAWKKKNQNEVEIIKMYTQSNSNE